MASLSFDSLVYVIKDYGVFTQIVFPAVAFVYGFPLCLGIFLIKDAQPAIQLSIISQSERIHLV